MANYYECLGVDPQASREDIRKAYKRLAKKYHPDVNQGDPKANERFIELKKAYDTLYSPLEREKYDAKLGHSTKQTNDQDTGQANHAEGKTTQHPGQGFDPRSVHQTFEQFFGFNPKTKNGPVKKPNAGAKKKNPLDTSDFFDSYFGRK